jgi:hypothetical protein
MHLIYTFRADNILGHKGEEIKDYRINSIMCSFVIFSPYETIVGLPDKEKAV